LSTNTASTILLIIKGGKHLLLESLNRAEGFQKLSFGKEEIAIPVLSTIEAACDTHPTADVFINFASFRSDNIIGLSLWHEMATKFNVQEYKTMEKPIVIELIEKVRTAPTHSVEVYFSSLDDDKSVSASAGIQVSVQTKQAARVHVDETSHCSLSAQNDLGALLKRCKLIIWDEVPMANKLCFEALDHSFRDIQCKNRYDTCTHPFGNMTMVFGSGFRQVLLVIPKGSRQDIVTASLKQPYLWDHCNVLKLTANMRLTVGALPEDVTEIQEFSEWILKVGDDELGEPRRRGIYRSTRRNFN
ncbi:ATP-dependent DNA helicase PIF1-like protein, partial [Tanacetum coccineum]